jgi:hypothetical protein
MAQVASLATGATSQSLKFALGSILLLTIVATIFLSLAIAQTDVMFFGDGAWTNERGCFAEARVYTLALFTVTLSFVTASYGFLRDCIADSSNRKIFDRAFSIGASSSGSLFAACCILFLNFRLEPAGQNFAEGGVAKLVFGICSFILWMIYFGLMVRKGGCGADGKKKNSRSSVDNSPLL